jgi:phospho-N-acetylmuramoyl-pentapeptide-transferase
MLSFFLSFLLGFVTCFYLTKLTIFIMKSKTIGQPIRSEGPEKHKVKHGTPTAGGIAIMLGIVIGYLAPKLLIHTNVSYSALLCLWTMCGMGIIGLIDDLIKLTNRDNLGLRARSKLLMQSIVVLIYYVVSFQKIYILNHPTTLLRSFAINYFSVSNNSSILRFLSHSYISIPLFLIFTYLIVSGLTNAVNLTDGLDGLAIGTAIFVFLTYFLMALWEHNQSCENFTYNCYAVYDSRDLASLCLAALGASVAFLWWNAYPAKIFMGDVGAFSIGGLIAALSMVLHMLVIGIVVNGLFILIALSVTFQILCFKLLKRRMFKMAPLQHHFELKGWHEMNVVIRFWIIAGLFSLFGLAIFYAEWVHKLYSLYND